MNFDNWKDINDNEKNEDFDSEIFKYMAPSQSQKQKKSQLQIFFLHKTKINELISSQLKNVEN